MIPIARMWPWSVPLLAVLAGVLAPDAVGKPRRPPKPADHYTFSPRHLAEKTAAYLERHDRVIVLDERVTEVTEGEPIPRLTWKGRRIDAFRESPAQPITLEFRVPRSAQIDALNVYLVQPDGETGAKLDEADLQMEGDSLLVLTVTEMGGATVVDVQYAFGGIGVSVDETFLFQPGWPVMRNEYRFAVSRELWQDAADAGMVWEFSATAQPRTWQPRRDDSPDFYQWYWRETNIEPVSKSDPAPVARSVTVTGYLPAPVLAGFDPDDLPEIGSLADIMDFQESLMTTATESEDRGGSLDGGYSDYQSSRPATGSVPVSTGK